MRTLSVIIPAYNAQDTLRESLDSLLVQRGAELQIIVVNDGSTDGTEQVLEEFSQLHSLEILNQENRGLGAARNAGSQRATGDWIAFLDADDRWTPNKVDVLSKFIGKHPEAEWVYHNVWEWFLDGSLRKRNTKTFSQFSDLWGNNPFTPSATAIKKTTYDKTQGWEERRDRVEDLGLWKSLIDLGIQPLHISRPLTKYRVGAGITSNAEDHFAKVSNVWKEWVESGAMSTMEYNLAIQRKHYEMGRYFHKASEFEKARYHYKRSPISAAQRLLVLATQMGLSL